MSGTGRSRQQSFTFFGLGSSEVLTNFIGTLNAKIISVVKRRSLTHLEVANVSGISRARITALLNCNTKHVPTSLIIRLHVALGVRVRLSYSPIKHAA